MALQTAREKRKKQMTEKGYFILTPSERAARLRKGLDTLKASFSGLEEETRDWLRRGDPKGSHE